MSEATCYDTERMRLTYLMESTYHVLIWAAGALPAEHRLPRIHQWRKNTKHGTPKKSERQLTPFELSTNFVSVCNSSPERNDLNPELKGSSGGTMIGICPFQRTFFAFGKRSRINASCELSSTFTCLSIILNERSCSILPLVNLFTAIWASA